MDIHLLPTFKSIEDILEYALNEEKDATSFYLEVSKKTDNPDLKRFLIGLAEMEEHHYTVLKNKLEECKANHFCTDGILSSFHEEEAPLDAV
ncbi:MAG: hypothetical protein ISR83_04415 [Candidatus Marinimicrobia bacterium]|nr:hypothetical protein [Candidatus Neomarinimicrobiota bacterium]